MESGESIKFFEDDCTVKRVYADGKRQAAGQVRLSVWTDHVSAARISAQTIDNDAAKDCDDSADIINIDYSDVETLFLFKKITMNCKVKGRDYVYELRGGDTANMMKYRDLFEIIK